MNRAAPLACGGSVIAALLVVLSRYYPFVGHDFSYFIPRLIDTDLYLRVNGPSIQWYTATFGGGLPAFANPQHLEYSLAQLMLYLTSPWLSVLLTTALVSAAGYAACYQFFRRTLGLERLPAALGAAFFLGNGFYIEHMIVGHLGFQLFPLGAVILFALTNRSQGALANGSLAALSIALMVHQAGAYLLLLTAGSILLAAQVVYLVDHERIDWARAARSLAIAAPLSIAMAGTKLFAVQSLMRQFPREVIDIYPITMVQGVVGVLAQFAGGMLIMPALMLVGILPQRLDDLLNILTRAGGHVWEVDTGLSPVLTAVLMIGLARVLASLARQQFPRLTRDRAIVLVALVITSWVAVETTLAKGLVFPFLKSLPILRSIHVNQRVASVFILPLTIGGAVMLNRWFLKRPPASLVAAVLVLTMASPWIYLVLPPETHRRNFDMTQSVRDHERIRAGERLPTVRIAQVDDAQAFSQGASSARPYEPLFGYDAEMFTPQTHDGDIYAEDHGRLNMTNPASLVFPDINHLRPFDRITIDDRANLEKLAAHRQADWRLPPGVPWLNRASLLALAFCLVVVVAGLRPTAWPGTRGR